MTSASVISAISRHPGFKYAVALWFAALLGLGLFVMPGAIHDLLASGTGLARLTAAAQPPVGMAGRTLLAGIAALLGLLLGLAVARRVALANAAQDEDDDELYPYGEPAAPESAPGERSVWLGDVPARQHAHRVFNPRAEIDEEGIAGPAHSDHAPADSSPDDPEDALIEDAPDWTAPIDDEPAAAWSVEEAAEDALTQLWREETGQNEDHVPEMAVAEDADAAADTRGDDSCIETGESSEPAEERDFGGPETLPAPAPAAPEEAFGDMSLGALTDRLRHALADVRMRKAAEAGPPAPVEDEPDPVIAFLRREAERHAPGDEAAPMFEGDPQAALRGALDRLSGAGKPN